MDKGHDNVHFAIQVPPNNDGVYQVICPNGHQFSVDILSHHFHVLFENAIHSLSDDYYIESFVSFAASYERFIEYFLNIVLRSNNVSKPEFDETWKELAKQSERQIGAFYMLYLQEFKKKPAQLSNPNKELRNKVIHKGYLPSKEDCTKFGNNVLEFIRQIIEQLKNEEKYNIELIRSVNESRSKASGSKIHHFPYQIFAINRPLNQTDKKTVDDLVEDQRNNKNKI